MVVGVLCELMVWLCNDGLRVLVLAIAVWTVARRTSSPAIGAKRIVRLCCAMCRIALVVVGMMCWRMRWLVSLGCQMHNAQ